MLEGDDHFVTMVGHMSTASLFQKEVRSSVLDVLFNSVHKNAEEKTAMLKKNYFEKCIKYKEVEENQELLLKKSEKIS